MKSFHYEKAEVRGPDRRWYERISLSCCGFICLYQEHPTLLLKLYTPKARKIVCAVFERFKDTPGVELDNDFSGWEAELIFPPELLMEVCERAGARKKRRGRSLTNKQREAFWEGRQKGLAVLQKRKEILL
jgi:hypothetical protein